MIQDSEVLVAARRGCRGVDEAAAALPKPVEGAVVHGNDVLGAVSGEEVGIKNAQASLEVVGEQIGGGDLAVLQRHDPRLVGRELGGGLGACCQRLARWIVFAGADNDEESNTA